MEGVAIDQISRLTTKGSRKLNGLTPQDDPIGLGRADDGNPDSIRSIVETRENLRHPPTQFGTTRDTLKGASPRSAFDPDVKETP